MFQSENLHAHVLRGAVDQVISGLTRVCNRPLNPLVRSVLSGSMWCGTTLQDSLEMVSNLFQYSERNCKHVKNMYSVYLKTKDD
ncbi:uncharacterized protein Dwil_GK28280 [Drosophila willistoni]|uniref:Uncharacterized protein n=1 Tax=Drosophila willistoni TaxID=7260 RepID=A0A0Q9WVH4_DROWI|nr:uncharacterized protein Dwil_GK28280 [Drosophila willistoni]